jgi:hypothetical protein
MDLKQLMCRSCTGLADPGVYLLDPNHHRIYKWLQDHLNLTVSIHIILKVLLHETVPQQGNIVQ